MYTLFVHFISFIYFNRKESTSMSKNMGMGSGGLDKSLSSLTDSPKLPSVARLPETYIIMMNDDDE
jgi:hypothetical protein